MTAITPLEFVHKKGIFGDHQKKNESDLLKGFQKVQEIHFQSLVRKAG